MSIWTEVLAFIRHPDRASFEPLALRVFRHQFDSVARYREYCLERDVRPEAVVTIDDVPPISTVAFKHVELAGGPAERVFRTSGTTIGALERGRHFIPRLEIYRASATRHLEQMLFPDRLRTRMLALHPTADLMPESSLAQMISWCIEEFGNGRALCAANRQGLALAQARGFLLDCARAGEPVCILATTAACGALFSSLSESNTVVRLAARSRMMDTGGAKGQAAPLSSEALLAAAERWLGIGAPFVINEYGMTEMCSQLYDLTAFNGSEVEVAHRPSPASAPGMRAKLGPPWLRAVALDPISLKRVPNCQAGLLSFFDLANVGSVSALVTEDFGIVEEDAVFVLGRASGEARGCALGIAEFAAREDRRLSARRASDEA